MIYSLDTITKQYQTRDGVVPSLYGVSINVRTGERLALLGKSGAGKTTLFRLLNATLRPTSGTLHFDGNNVAAMNSSSLRMMRRRIGTVYQQHQLVPSLSVLDNTLCGRLGYWSLLHTMRSALRPAKNEIEQAIQALESVGLADKQKARADQLSGGQQQRLAIARVLMQDPEVILADEPIASLDPRLAEAITSLLIKLADDGKRTLIVTLHAVELALRHFPRVIALREGRIALDADASAVKQKELRMIFSDDNGQSDVLKEGQTDADAWQRLRCTL